MGIFASLRVSSCWVFVVLFFLSCLVTHAGVCAVGKDTSHHGLAFKGGAGDAMMHLIFAYSSRNDVVSLTALRKDQREATVMGSDAAPWHLKVFFALLPHSFCSQETCRDQKLQMNSGCNGQL